MVQLWRIQRNLPEEFSKELKADGVDAVILTST